ncbi:acyltransferase ChoActase/COT/CPT [Backusella circina FSU 941]|nr:acyltransferase ChoActase/COT/CPT [Backusella circina FSU 941]
MSSTPKTPINSNVNNPMFRNQSSLPRLPVPDLHTTLTKYLLSARPLIDDEQYEITRQAVQEFEAPGSLGQELQRRLIERYNDPKIVNWMDNLFINNDYLKERGSFHSSSSYFFAYKDDKSRTTPVKRAASITTAALEFKKLVTERNIEPDYVGDQPLCMDMYNYLFNSSRVASTPIDTAIEYNPFLNTHIVVIRKNRFYFIDTVHNGHQLNTKELEQQFQSVIDHAGSNKGMAIGCFTTEERDTWAKYRDRLLEIDLKNRDGLEKIQSASFLVCLDDTSPQTHDEITVASYHGDGRNRFFDKTLQFIIFENGKASLQGEHTRIDGSCAHRFSEYICNGLSKNLIHHGSDNIRQGIPQPSEITFVTDKTIESAILQAERKFDEYAASHDMTVLVYTLLGSKFIKKCKISPDGLVQMILQLAYFKMFGTSRSTYESTMIRTFQHGRTEICRVVCEDSVAFVVALENPNMTREAKISALRSALKTQDTSMENAKNGRGIDRHLLCLQALLQTGENLPALFRDNAFLYSKKWHFSSTQVTSKHFECFGFAEVVEDGISSPYMIGPDVLQFSISSFKNIIIDGEKYSDVTFKFKKYLKMACDDVYTLLITEKTDLGKL